eukprot:CAMPEP_0180010814 /NCGR_PEP_ID=MMETSP0984-20121128/15982_1 /TAXON_ID=483367 /ORGANISM="non described non described, Strain CCMP 2436" /LENGTH=37 /DNA_ID= /DNA_START= /DNA_END= /DNA_ORIENTATION=
MQYTDTAGRHFDSCRASVTRGERARAASAAHAPKPDE